MDCSEKIATRWVATRAAASYCGLHEDTLRKMRTAGGGPRYARVGGAIRYDVRELDRYMAERTYANTADEAAAGRTR